METNKERYGLNFPEIIGRKGGQVSRGGGFAYGPLGHDRAVVAGTKGGRARKGNKYPKIKVTVEGDNDLPVEKVSTHTRRVSKIKKGLQLLRRRFLP